MTKTLCLFDIDGTLIRSGGAGQEAMFRTLGDEFGRTEIGGDIQAAGRTDFAITADLFADHGLDATDDVRHRFHETYIGHLEAVLPELDGCVLPGVFETLDRLRARDDVELGLLTGNFFRAAVAKLRHFGLASYFCPEGTLETAIGGYGDTHANRDDVARLAWSAADATPTAFTPDRTWVIGDTPADVTCGRAIGARTVAVTTGQFARRELEPAAPDFLLETLEDDDWIEAFG